MSRPNAYRMQKIRSAVTIERFPDKSVSRHQIKLHIGNISPSLHPQIREFIISALCHRTVEL